ncbi:MAG: ethanolamine utilization protein EutH [Marinobacter sp.]|nr:ethanolamine utilization protein EutH [Marinobacter sp.]
MKKPLLKMGGVLNINTTAATGLIATLANNIPMFQVMKDMDSRGKNPVLGLRRQRCLYLWRPPGFHRR